MRPYAVTYDLGAYRDASPVTLSAEAAARRYGSRAARLCVMAADSATASRLANAYGAALDSGDASAFAVDMRGPGRAVPVISWSEARSC